LRLYSPQLLGGKEKDAGRKEKRARGKGQGEKWGRGNVKKYEFVCVVLAHTQ
jgi:hypothetical protein